MGVHTIKCTLLNYVNCFHIYTLKSIFRPKEPGGSLLLGVVVLWLSRPRPKQTIVGSNHRQGKQFCNVYTVIL
jgi:hypothetical protein